MRLPAIMIAVLLLAGPTYGGPLDGKTYIIELSSSQYSSGYGEYLLPPLGKALARSGMRAKNGPGADMVVNIVTASDTGRWTDEGGAQVWLYRISVTIGISPENYSIPIDGTPAFGVTAGLDTPNPDREREMNCLIGLATRTALANYQPKGHRQTDGQSCRKD